VIITVLQINDILPYDLFGEIAGLLGGLFNGILHPSPGMPGATGIIWALAFFISMGIILLFLWITKNLFLKFRDMQSCFIELILVSGILCVTVFRFLTPINKPLYFAAAAKQVGNEIIAVLFFVWDLFIWNFWWVLVVILPVYLLYPEIRERKLWKHVVACFALTVFLRYVFEYCLAFTVMKNYSVFTPEITYTLPYFNFFYLAMMLLVFFLACSIYEIILYLDQKVPKIHTWLAVDA
jgi:hypothetical protein